MTSPHRERRALTLVEVLVIVAILGLLLALMLPAIMRLRTYAAQLEDIEQLRKLGKAWLLYAQLHQGRPVDHKTGEVTYDRWIKKLSPYADDIDQIIVSPGDPNQDARFKFMEQNPGRKSSSFVLNPYFATRIENPITKEVLSCEKLSDCKSLSTAIAILPVSRDASVPGAGYIFPQGWFSGPPELIWRRTTGRLGIQPDRFLTTAIDDTPGTANYLFADGHVEGLTARHIRELVESGKNFLIPEK
jgi:prepilin-type processing-associated H-X9-DG protein